MLALTALAILIPLLVVPGYLIARALRGGDLSPTLLDRCYDYVVIGALLNGWLAFTLAEIGIFSLWSHLLALLAIGGLAGLLAWRRGGVGWTRAPLGIVAWSAGGRAGFRTRVAANWEMVLFGAIGVVFALLVARPFETVLGVRDAGVYANAGFAIARTGAIVQYDPLVTQIGQDLPARDPDLQATQDPTLTAAAAQAETNFLGVQSAQRSIATRLRAAGFFINDGELALGRVVPQGFHLLPAWIGLLTSLLGFQGGLLAMGLMGFLGVWSVGMLGRQLAGPWAGAIAALLLALNGVQVWFSRYSTAETTTQFLCFAGLAYFAIMADAPRTNDMPRRPWSFGRLDRAEFAALLAGVAFGQWALARIDFLLIVPLLGGYLLYTWLAHRWTRTHTLLALGFGALLLHAVVHIIVIARAYFLDTLYSRLQDQSAFVSALVLPFLTDELRRVYVTTSRSVFKQPFRILLELLLFQGFLALCIWLRRDRRLLARMAEIAGRFGGPLARIAAVAIVLIGIYGYFVRPQVLSARVLAGLPGCLSAEQIRQPTGDCLTLQGYVGAPIPLPPGRPVYTIPLAGMVRLGWYLSPLGAVLGVAGFALWWWRGLRRSSWLFLCLGLLTSFFFIRQTYGTGDQTYIYILRRFVPQVYPVFCLGIAYALVALARMLDSRRPAPGEQGQLRAMLARLGAIGAPALLLLALVSFLAMTNRTLYRHTEYGGALAQLAAVAERFGPRDVLLFRGGAPTYAGSRDLPDNITTPLTYMFGLNAITIKSREPGNYAEPLARYVQRWRDEGRTVYLVLGASGAFELPGFALEPAGPIALTGLDEFQQSTDQKPANIQSYDLDFMVYRLVPAGSVPPAREFAPGDYAAQVRGFYHPEQRDGRTFAWTDGDALLRLPWPHGASAVTATLQLAGGLRPASISPARACLSFRPETSFWVEDPAQIFSQPACFTLTEQMASYSLRIAPGQLPTGTLLLRIESPPWVPAKADPALRDGRGLGVQFGRLTLVDTPPP